MGLRVVDKSCLCHVLKRLASLCTVLDKALSKRVYVLAVYVCVSENRPVERTLRNTHLSSNSSGCCRINSVFTSSDGKVRQHETTEALHPVNKNDLDTRLLVASKDHH